MYLWWELNLSNRQSKQQKTTGTFKQKTDLLKWYWILWSRRTVGKRVSEAVLLEEWLTSDFLPRKTKFPSLCHGVAVTGPWLCGGLKAWSPEAQSSYHSYSSGHQDGFSTSLFFARTAHHSKSKAFAFDYLSLRHKPKHQLGEKLGKVRIGPPAPATAGRLCRCHQGS